MEVDVMALKDKWTDKVDGDDILAETTNEIARAVIELEEKNGDIDTALDELHAYAQGLVIGGDAS
jgi:hypothetical protein